MRTKNTLLLRAAHASEATAIAALSRVEIEYGLRWRWTPSRVRRAIGEPETMVLVATQDGELRGFAIMRFGDSDAHLHLLAVEAKHRRQGVGRAMLDWLEKSCRVAGMQAIRLELRAGNRGAQAFYAALGYEPVGRIEGYYERRETALILGKPLLTSG